MDDKNINQESNKFSVKRTFFHNSSFNKRIQKVLIGGLGGAILGILYWEFIGCNRGSCPLTSSPFKTVMFFTFVGAYVGWK